MTSESAEVHYPTEDDEPDGKRRIRDFISGRLIAATPEEVETTQPVSMQLVEDYGYPKEFIQTRPQFRVKARPSSQHREFPVDIAIFKDEKRRPDDVYVVIECKKNGTPSEAGDDRQIFNYLRFSSAEIGVWTNGEERQVFRKIVTDKSIDFEQIPNLPRHGEHVDEVGKYRRRNLVPPRHLSTTFKAIRSHLSANAVGTTRDEALAQELINLVFCKIYDEKFTSPNDLLSFRVSIGEHADTVRQRIVDLFEQVKSKYSDVFSKDDKISLDGPALTYVVGELQPFCLIEAPRDAVGEAFEVFIGATLKGSQGQFFTPRNVVQLIIQIVDPSVNDLVIDPACGPGGFLVESLRHKWHSLDDSALELHWTQQALAEEKASVAIKTIFGIEKDSFLAKVAKAYMAIMGDGKGGIHCEDSLDLPNNWSRSTQQDVVLGRFDVVVANPPFGKDIKVVGSHKLRQFDLGHRHQRGVRTDKLEDSQNPQILFIERCIQLAKRGGRVGLILPETYFHAPSIRHVTKMMTSHNILALIDLPHNTFRPFNNAKCVAIIFEKDTPQQKEILMVGAEEMGHNHLGQPIYRYDTDTHAISDEIWDDITAASRELSAELHDKYTFLSSAKEVKENEIYIPRYYWNHLNASGNEGPAVSWITIQDLIDEGILNVSSGHGSPPSEFKGRGTYPYVRVKDVISWEIYRNPTSLIPLQQYERLAKKNPLQFEDVLYVARGSYRIGDVAIVGPDDLEMAITREIHIFRVKKNNAMGLSPYYLLYLLSSPQVAQQTRARVFMDTTLPNIGDRYRSIALPWNPSEKVRQDIESRVRKVLQSKWQSMSELRSLLAEIRPDTAESASKLFEDAED